MSIWRGSWGTSWGLSWGSSGSVVEADSNVQVNVSATADFTVVRYASANTVVRVQTQLNVEPDYEWNTAQGAAKSWLKFHPAVQHAEARFVEQKLEYSIAAVKPYATAVPNVSGGIGYAQFSYPHTFKANGYALASGSRGLLSTVAVVPYADSQAVPVQGASYGRVYKVKPKADAAATSQIQQAQSEIGFTRPFGIQNPTDEMLLLVVMEARRTRAQRIHRT